MQPYMRHADRAMYARLTKLIRRYCQHVSRHEPDHLLLTQLYSDLCRLLAHQKTEHWPTHAAQTCKRLFTHYRRQALRHGSY